MENYNWEEFYEHYDNLVNNWLSTDTRKQMISSDCYFNAEKSKKRSKNVKLSDSRLEVPEPYLGKPSNCSAVIINLNPALSWDNSERDLFYEQFVKDLSHKKYSEITCTFPHLEPDAIGYKFWIQKDRWIHRLCELNNKDSSGLRPFAMELCPYHSKSWNGNFINDEVRKCIDKWVLKPALAAIKLSLLPFALAIGKPCYTELKDKFQFKLLEFLGPDSNINGWPTNSNDVNANRYFALLEKDGLKVLCTWCKGGTNSAPAESFKDIEKSLLKNI